MSGGYARVSTTWHGDSPEDPGMVVVPSGSYAPPMHFELFTPGNPPPLPPGYEWADWPEDD